MSEEPPQRSGRGGMIFVALAIVGSAVASIGWYLSSNRAPGFDGSGFDMSTAPETPRPRLPQAAAPAPAAAPPAAPQTSLGMSVADESLEVAGPAPKAAPSDPKQAAVQTFKESAIKNEGAVSAYIRRMEAKHPSITQYGRDWAASPELSALRDQYWQDRNPLAFAYGLAKSGDFKKLLKKYSNDPGVRDVILSGFREVPADLVAATGGLTQHDKVVDDLALTVISSAGLPASVMAMFGGNAAEIKPPDQKQVISEMLNNDEMKKALGAAQQNPAQVDRSKLPKLNSR